MVKRKVTTSSTGKKLTPKEFDARKTHFIARIKGMVDVLRIPADLIINWYQIRIHPCTSWPVDS